MSPPLELLTRQKYDLQFGVNVLGHFYLTKLLLPVLLATAKATSEKVRVLNYSAAFSPLSRIDYTTLMDGPVRRKCSLQQLHRQSKLVCTTFVRIKIRDGTCLLTGAINYSQANVLFTLELAEQYGEQGIVSIAINPGNVHTGLSRHAGGVVSSIRVPEKIL